jgi:hypothetical protein
MGRALKIRRLFCDRFLTFQRPKSEIVRRMGMYHFTFQNDSSPHLFSEGRARGVSTRGLLMPQHRRFSLAKERQRLARLSALLRFALPGWEEETIDDSGFPYVFIPKGRELS